MNANAIITAALRRLVVVASGGTPTVNQLSDGREVLNDLVNSWSADTNLVYEDTLEEIAIAANTQSFTIGATGDKTTARPLKIISANLRDNSNFEYGLDIIDDSRYARIRDKTIISLPRSLHYRKSYPNGTMYFNCKSDTSYTLVLTSIKELTEFADGTTEYNLPAHYERAFKTNLAIEIAPEMGAAKRVTQLMLQQAEEAKQTIIGDAMQLNASTTELYRKNVYSINGDTY